MEHETQSPLEYESNLNPAREPPEHEFQTVTEAVVRTIAWIAGLSWLIWGVSDDLNTRGAGPAICGLLCILIAEVIRLRATLRRLLGGRRPRR